MARLWQDITPAEIEKIVNGLKTEGWKLQEEGHIQCSLVDFSRLTRDSYTVQFELNYNQRVLGMETLLVPSELVGKESGEYCLYVRPKQQDFK